MTLKTLIILLLFAASVSCQELQILDSMKLGYYTVPKGTVESPEGNVILVGVVYSYHTKGETPTSNSLFLKKYSSTGILMWEKRYYSSANTEASNVIKDKTGCFYIVINPRDSITIEGIRYPGGYSGYWSYLLKFAASGALLWVKGEPVPEVTSYIASNNSDCIYGLGANVSEGYVRKLDQNGHVIFSMKHPHSSGRLVVDDNDNIYASWNANFGSTNSINKYSSTGVLDLSIPCKNAPVIAPARSGVYVFTAGSYPGYCELTKYNNQGQAEWTIPTVVPSVPGGLVITSDEYDRVFVAGSLQNTMTIAGYSPKGVLTWSLSTTDRQYRASGLTAARDHCYLACHSSYEVAVGYLMRIRFPQDPLLSIPSETATTGNFAIFPNPSSSIFHICFQPVESEPLQLSVYDATGRLVITRRVPTCTQLSEAIDLNGQPKGVYLVEVYGTRTREVRRILLE